ncbi:MAG: hypothetical protein PHY45_10900 [Rhodocyclaceae bacterium]|nr:hypothetical protein [Rhodocyclaceae bacterium]
MKRQFLTNPGRCLLVVAVAALAPLTAAQASDFTTSGIMGEFQRDANMPMPSAADTAAMQAGRHVQHNPLGWEIVTYDNAPAGAQGPMRGDEEAAAHAAAAREDQAKYWQRALGPVGGVDTP